MIVERLRLQSVLISYRPAWLARLSRVSRPARQSLPARSSRRARHPRDSSASPRASLTVGSSLSRRAGCSHGPRSPGNPGDGLTTREGGGSDRDGVTGGSRRPGRSRGAGPALHTRQTLSSRVAGLPSRSLQKSGQTLPDCFTATTHPRTSPAWLPNISLFPRSPGVSHLPLRSSRPCRPRLSDLSWRSGWSSVSSGSLSSG